MQCSRKGRYPRYLCYIENTVDFKKHPYAVQVVYTEYKTREDSEGNWFCRELGQAIMVSAMTTGQPIQLIYSAEKYQICSQLYTILQEVLDIICFITACKMPSLCERIPRLFLIFKMMRASELDTWWTNIAKC